MGEISHITSRFSDTPLQESSLELEIRREIWDSVTNPEGGRVPNEYVEWHVYKIEACVPGRQEPIIAEAGRTLYSRLTGEPHQTYAPEGDSETISNLAHFFDYLRKRGARALITEDSSGLFEDIGSLGSLDTQEASLLIAYSSSNHAGTDRPYELSAEAN